MARRRIPGRQHIAMIADMVGSRGIAPAARGAVQRSLTTMIERLNDLYQAHLTAKFVVTLGDEFQGLLHTAEVVPELIWQLERSFTERPLRVGIGYGLLYTAVGEYAINVDGPALHNARASVDAAKQHAQIGGVFTGFGEGIDAALNGFARILHHQRTVWTNRQREVVVRLHDGLKGTEVAEAMGISKQAVSRYAADAGWSAYKEAEQGWRRLLRAVDEKGVAR